MVLSPPIIGSPIYDCSQIIAFSGADRDSIIDVFVNGNHITQIQTWMGWGEIRLPYPLSTGDSVSATQTKAGLPPSIPTIKPEKVVNIPPDLLQSREKLFSPEIIPHLYECQKIVRVKNVLEGGTVTLRDLDANTYHDDTPYNIVRIVVPPIKIGIEETDPYWFKASQRICKDIPYSSDWSLKEYTKRKPTSMPEPVLENPIDGNDALRVDNLFPGSEVEIKARHLHGGNDLRVGGGIALDTSVIFKIDPPFDVQNFKYGVEETLCDIRSVSNFVSPNTTISTPIIQNICQGDNFITVCNTDLMSTVEIYADGNSIGGFAGNGDCVTVGLDRELSANDKGVTARQFIGGIGGNPSEVVPVKTNGAPTYDPTIWNDPNHVLCNNCYNYACDIMTDTYATPGYASDVELNMLALTCPEVGNAAIADGLKQEPEKKCLKCTHLVALVVSTSDQDYHWYRLDDNGRWSHKPGQHAATDLDASNKPITNPEMANRQYIGRDYEINYDMFCAYYCVDKKLVKIRGWETNE